MRRAFVFGFAGLVAWLAQAVLAVAAMETPLPPAANLTATTPTAPATPAPAMAEAPAVQSAQVPGDALTDLPLQLSESSYFEVVGLDSISVQGVMRMALRLKSILELYFTFPAGSARPIQVKLVPPTLADFSGPFDVRSESSGHRIIRVRWDDKTTISDVCQALSSGALERLAVWRGGVDSGAKVPDWMKVAFGEILEVSLYPAVADDFFEEATRQPSLSLRQIMTATGPYDASQRAVLGVNAYWLTRFLEDEAGGAAQVSPLLVALAGGTPPPEALSQAFPGRFSDGATLELWWAVGYRDMISRKTPPLQTMAQTRALLDDLESMVIEAAGHDQRLSVGDVWSQRTAPKVRAALKTRFDRAREALPTANPVLYNALLSLGTSLEALQHDDATAFRAAWKRYQVDRTQGEAVMAEVQSALAAGSPPSAPSTQETPAPPAP